MKNALVNCSGKIQLFWSNNQRGEVISNTIQQLTLKFTHQINHKQILITIIYAGYSAIERLGLWEDLEWIVDGLQLPWLVGGLQCYHE